jgi:hypothetical protein
MADGDFQAPFIWSAAVFGPGPKRIAMSNLLFLRRCFAYRYAACMEFHKARMLPRGLERNQVRKLARALRDLARNEAWLEGQTLGAHHNDALPAFDSATLVPIGRGSGSAAESASAAITSRAAPA